MTNLSLNPFSLNQTHSFDRTKLVEDAEQHPLLLLQDAQALLAKLRAKEPVDDAEIQNLATLLNQAYPGPETAHFLQYYHSYTDIQLEDAQRFLAKKQQELIREFFPQLKNEGPKVTSETNVGYSLIKVSELYEQKQLKLIVKHDQENKKTIEQLNVLNDALNLMLSLRDKQNVDEATLKLAVDRLNQEFPDLQFQDFLEGHKKFTDEQWTRAQDKISNKQKMLMALFNPKMSEIEELVSDKNKVHEIISEILKQLNELNRYIVRRQAGG